MFEINSILRAAPDCKTLFEGFVRFLGRDDDGNALLIKLDEYPLKAPFEIPLLDLNSAILAEEILTDQVFDTGVPRIKEQLSDASKARIEKAMAIMAPLLADEDILFDPEHRSRQFKAHSKKETSKKRRASKKRQIRRLYYEYLAGGQTEIAFATLRHNCGGSGPHEKGRKRRGRKPKGSSKIPLPEIRGKLEKGARLYRMPGKRTLKEAFVATQKRFFSKGARLLKGKKLKDLKLEEILLPPDKQPTEAQFRYVCEQLEKKLGKRVGRTRGNKSGKKKSASRGKARDGIKGPGYRYEIDATKIQVQLVSRYGRDKLVGNATLYIIIDVWSGCIVGYSISLEGESWALAANALKNCFTKKSKIFKRLGLDYEDEDWHTYHLPTLLTADRAALVSDRAGVVPELGIIVQICAPMCPQQKGSVEAEINKIKHRRSKRLPGGYKKIRNRRDPDGKKTAALTIDELETIIVEIIISLNHDPVPASYIPEELIRMGETNVSHMGLYKWGLKHKTGFTRKISEQEVYTHLMTQATASVTSAGLSFKKQTFNSPLLHSSMLTTKAAKNGSFKIEIRYDEHFADQIWFFNKLKQQWQPAFNSNEEIRKRRVAFYEIETYLETVNELRETTKRENIHKDQEKEKDQNKMIKQAEKEAKQAKKGKTHAQATRGIRENRKIEKEASRIKAAEESLSTISGQEVADEQKSPVTSTTEESGVTDKNQSAEKPSVTKLSLSMWGKNKK